MPTRARQSDLYSSAIVDLQTRARQTFFTRVDDRIQCHTKSVHRCNKYHFLLPDTVECTERGLGNYTHCRLYYAAYTTKIIGVMCEQRCVVLVDIDDAVALYQYSKVIQMCIGGVILLVLLITGMVRANTKNRLLPV